MKTDADRDFQIDAIEVALHQINRQLAKMDQERKQEEKDSTPSLAEKTVNAARDHLEENGKHLQSSLLGVGYAVLSGIFSGAMSDSVSPLVSSEARKWI